MSCKLLLWPWNFRPYNLRWLFSSLDTGTTMPNWCENELKIKGERAAIDEFLARARTAHIELWPQDARKRKFVTGAGFEGDQWFSFHAFVPIPRAMRKPERFRDWAISHWDTKWDARIATVSWSKSKKIAYVGLMTAWGPPELVIRSMRQQYPQLDIRCKWRDEFGDKGTIVCLN
jgi:hypothetical protein